MARPPPTMAWKVEYAELTDKRKILNQRYVALKGEVREAEQIRKITVFCVRSSESSKRAGRRILNCKHSKESRKKLLYP